MVMDGNGWLWMVMEWLIGAYCHPLSPIASFSPIDILTTPREYQLPGPLARRLRGAPRRREPRAGGSITPKLLTHVYFNLRADYGFLTRANYPGEATVSRKGERLFVLTQTDHHGERKGRAKVKSNGTVTCCWDWKL